MNQLIQQLTCDQYIVDLYNGHLEVSIIKFSRVKNRYIWRYYKYVA